MVKQQVMFPRMGNECVDEAEKRDGKESGTEKEKELGLVNLRTC